MATSREAELESPPPRGTELTTTALKPGSGVAAGNRMVLVRRDAGSVDTGKPYLVNLLSSRGPSALHSTTL